MSSSTFPIITEKAFIVDEEVAAYVRRAHEAFRETLPKEIANMSDAAFAEAAKKGGLLCDGAPYVDSMSDILDILQEYKCSDGSFFYADMFDGEVEYCHVNGDGAYMGNNADFAPLTRCFEDDYIIWAEPAKKADYFSASYASEDELISEYKGLFSEFGFPENFNWKAHIVNITGTYFC